MRPTAGTMRWAVATLSPGDQVLGMIGPFGSLTAALTYAQANGPGVCTVVPMLVLAGPDETQVP